MTTQSKIEIVGVDHTGSAFKSVIDNIEKVNHATAGLSKNFGSVSGSIKTSLGTEATSALAAATGGVNGLSSSITPLITKMGGLKGAALASGAILLANSLKNSIAETIKYQDAVGKMSIRTGLAVETIGALNYVASQTDVNVEQLAKATVKLGVLGTDAANGVGKAVTKLSALGIEAQEFAKASPEQKLLLFTKALNQFSEDERPIVIAKVLGAKFTELTTALGTSESEMLKLLTRGKELNKVTDESSKAAQDFNDNLDTVSKRIGSVGISIANIALPHLADFTKYLDSNTASLLKNIQELSDYVRKVGAVGTINKVFGDGKLADKLEKENSVLKQSVSGRIKLANEVEKANEKIETPKKPTRSLSAFGGDEDKKKTGGVSRKKEISESQRFIESLQKESESFGKTRIELLKLQAAKLGLSNVAEQYISAIERTDAAQKAEAKSAELLAERNQNIKDVLQSILTPYEKFQQQLTETNALLSKKPGDGGLSVEQYRKKVGLLIEDYEKIGDSAKKGFDLAEQYAIQAARNIQSAFADALYNLFTGQGNFFENISNVFVRNLSEKLSRDILSNVGGFEFLNGGTSKNNNAQSYAANTFDYFNDYALKKDGENFGKTASNAITKGAKSSGGFFSSLTNLFSSGGKGGSGGLSNLLSSFGGGSAGMASAAIGATIAGINIGQSFSGDKKIAGLNSTHTALAGFALGGPVGAVAGAFLPGLFGRGPYKLKARNLAGTAEGDTVEAETIDKYKAKGGLLVSSKKKFITKDLDEEIEAELEKTLKGFRKAIKDTAKILGISASEVEKFKAQFNIKLDHKNEDVAKKQIEDLFNSFGNTMTQMVMPSIAELKEKGETLLEAFVRIGSNFQALVDATIIFNKSLSEGRDLIRAFGHEASQAFIELFGTVEEFSGLVNFYANEFLSESQRIQRQKEFASDELKRIGLPDISTRAQYKALIESAATGGISKEQLAELLKLAPTFDAIFDSLEKGADSINGIASSISELENSLRETYETRKAELESVRDSFKDIIKNLQQYRQSLVQGALSPLTPGQKLEEARTTLNRTLLEARKGDKDAIADFPRVADEFLKASQVWNASSAAYLSDFNLILSLNEELQAISKDQIDYAEEQLKTLKDSVSHLIDISENTKTVAELIKDLTAAMAAGSGNPTISNEKINQVANDPNLTNQQKLDWAKNNGVSDSQIINAIPGITQRDLDLIRNPNTTPTSTISDAQIRDFVNANLNNPRAIYDAAVTNNISRFRLAQVMGWNVADIEEWVRQNNLAMFKNGTDRVPRDGLAFLHKNEAVVPSSVAVLLEKLINEITMLRKEQSIQTGELISSQVRSAIENATQIATEMNNQSRNQSWYQNQFQVAGVRK